MKIYELTPKYDSRASFYGKAKVIVTNGSLALFSYDTKVCTIESGKVKVYGEYSQTTMRHIKEFLLQSGSNAESKKQIIKDYMIK